MIDLDQVPELDLVLTGSVAVNLKGARVGKGGGFSDLEYALLCESGKIDRRTVIATTVHPIQILRENLLMTAHDIPVGLVATPRAVIEVDGAHRAPAGHPLGPPAAAADPRDPGAGAVRLRRLSSARARLHREHRLAAARSSSLPVASPPITPSRSTTSSFHGCRIVAGTMPASRARTMLTGLSSTSTSMPSSTQRVTLSNEQCRSS